MVHQDVIKKIEKLKKENDAIILAHNYQLPEIQDIGDFVGDSLSLCQEAARTNAKVIIFCGVWFMAESAALLNPDKKVILPDPEAGCPMADMVKPAELMKLKEEHPDAVVVCYINSNAEIKALSDICCTSSNARSVVESIPEDKQIIFIPDKYLGKYVAEKTGRPLILWPGFCIVHQRILPEHVLEKKTAYPNALVLVHPECSGRVIALADFVGSTGKIIAYCRESKEKEFIICTEMGILHALRQNNPDKIFIQASEHAVCRNMKKITLDKVITSLETLQPIIEVNTNIQKDALKPIQRMLEIKIKKGDINGK
ncbi:MAG: quinolinate synthase NadA [Spirochaetales bacterium]|nr:quinolinate synthase NadA [Spirochaetales bacterium]